MGSCDKYSKYAADECDRLPGELGVGGDGRGTIVKVEMKYDPPAGKFGAAIAKFFGADAESEIEESLAKLKQLLEGGAIREEQRKAA